MDDNLLQLLDGSKAYGSKVLFNRARFAINAGEHVGIIGPNGAGKSTLFKVLLGEEELDHGELIRSKKLSLGYLSQHDHWLEGETGEQYLERTSKIPLWELRAQGRSLQITDALLSKPVLQLSGGYRMRIKMLGLLGQEPNLMLLDEPTNYLDLETTLLLEQFLLEYQGTFLLISHDREFLRRTTDHILEIESGELTKYNGNIDDYFEQKELIKTQLESRAAGLAEKRASILEFVERFGAKATKAKQAQSRLKQLDKMEVIEIKPVPVRASIRLPEPIQTGKSVIKIENAALGYPERTVLKNVSVHISRGDHVAVVGLNGAGKSTLLKGLSGVLKPLSGTLEYGKDVSVALYAQHVVEDLDTADTVLESLERATHKSVTQQEVLNLAGSLLFSGDAVYKKISVLSGGEKSRVALGRVLLRKAPCLILDEPTNHLDFQTVEALTLALKNYAGTVIVVSHDRGFVRRISSKILEVSNGQVNVYPGSYDDYVWALQRQMRPTEEGSATSSTTHNSSQATSAQPASNEKFNWKEAKKELDRRMRTCERQIELYEKEIAQKESENRLLNEKLATADTPELSWINQLSTNQARINEIEELWLRLEEERSAISDEIKALIQN